MMIRGALTEEQRELVRRLKRAGMQKNVATTLVFIASKDETISRDIEYATGLRQPEVSISMQELKNRDWVTKRDIKKEGKGRPVHGYKLKKSIRQIIKEIESEEKQRIQVIRDNLKAINELVKSIY